MYSERDVNEVLNGKMTPTMKYSYLKHVQDKLKELYSLLTISKNQYEYMMNYTTDRWEELIKNNPDAFKLLKNKDDKEKPKFMNEQG